MANFNVRLFLFNDQTKKARESKREVDNYTIAPSHAGGPYNRLSTLLTLINLDSDMYDHVMVEDKKTGATIYEIKKIVPVMLDNGEKFKDVYLKEVEYVKVKR